MNLGELRKRVEYELRHAPAVRAHRDEITARLNSALDLLVLGVPWTFRQRYWNVRLKADTTLASGSWTKNPTVTFPSTITSTEAVSRGFTFTSTGWTAADIGLLAGQVCVVSGSTSPTANGTFLIESAFVVSTVSATQHVVAIILDPRFPGEASVSAATQLVIRWSRYRLPADCADVDGLVLRDSDQGRIPEVSLRREEALLLREDDDPGLPQAFVMSPNLVDQYPNESTYHMPHVDVAAPLTPPTLASSNSTGTLVNSATYEYCYNWLVGGLTSGPSPTAKITLGASDNTVTISDMEVEGAAANALGRYKQVWRRRLYAASGDVEGYEGPWTIVTSTYSYDPDVTDTNALPYPGANPAAVSRLRQSGDSGQARHFRVWPLPATDVEAQLRYYARAPRMETPGDVPELPPELHMILVYDVCLDLAATQDGTAQLIRHLTARRAERIAYAKRVYLGNRGQRTRVLGVLPRGQGWTPRVNPPEFS